MDTEMLTYLSRFIYRIRYKLLWGTLLVTAFTTYITKFLPQTYTVNTTIFTGIASGNSIDSESSINWHETNTAFDNIINLVKSRKTLEKVSLHLLAQDLIYGNENKDNTYISAKNYKNLLKATEEIKHLVDKKSETKTVENFSAALEETPSNFFYKLLNGMDSYYSLNALNKVTVKRLGNSDMLEITYKSNDPGITYCTLEFLIKELLSSYENIRFGASSNVIKYFEQQLALTQKILKTQEDSLMAFSTTNQIINYAEQTKHLAALNNNYENRYQNIVLEYASSGKIVQQLEKQMNTKTLLIKENQDFVKTLDKISSLNSKITELETFSSKTTESDASILNDYKKALKEEENKIAEISNQMDIYKYSKEGVKIDEMVQQWLNALILHEKSGMELETMEQLRNKIDDDITRFSPLGPDLKRKEREVRVTEESYLKLLNELSQARLKQKNIEMTSSSLDVITPPSFPLLSNSNKKWLYVIATSFGSFLFILGFYLFIELIDKTIRDASRAKRLIKGNILGAFPGKGTLKYRGFDRESQRKAISHACNALNSYLHQDKTTLINIISMEPGEGKSYISKHMAEQWDNFALNVKELSYSKDFNINSKDFIEATSIANLCTLDSIDACQVVLIEHANLQTSSIPKALLQEADVNLLIINANRAWKNSDRHLFDKLKKLVAGKPLYIYLNKAEREAVEEFTGQLPPYTRRRKFIYNMFNFELTGRDL